MFSARAAYCRLRNILIGLGLVGEPDIQRLYPVSLQELAVDFTTGIAAYVQLNFLHMESLMSRRSGMARPLGVRGHKKSSQLIGSNKGPKYVPVDGPNEGTALLAMDIDPRTKRITPQPFTARLDIEKIFKSRSEAVTFMPRGRVIRKDGVEQLERVYTPDFLVELAMPVPLVVEVKSNCEVDKLTDSLDRRRRVLNNLGYNYLVVKNSEFEYEGLHTNLVNLRDSVRYRNTNDVIAQVANLGSVISKQNGSFSLGSIRALVSDLTIYLGLVAGVIACDLRAGPFSVNTALWHAYGDLSHLQLLNLDLES